MYCPREDRALRAAQIAFDLHAPRRLKLGNIQKHRLAVRGKRRCGDVQAVLVDVLGAILRAALEGPDFDGVVLRIVGRAGT